MKKTLAVLSWAAMSLVGLQSQAADSNGYVTSPDGPQTTALNPPGDALQRQENADPDATVVLFSNLNSDPSAVYDCCSGWEVSSRRSETHDESGVAMPFTPTVSGKVKKITVAVGYVSGSNAVTVRLNADFRGLPGTVIQSFRLTGLPAFGTCCTVEAEAVKGVTLKAGTQYWVVVRTTKPSSGTYDLWNRNNTDTSKKMFAFRNKHVWSPFTDTLSAFEVLGKPYGN